jgi:uncharacterized membrane protein YqjE
MTDRLPAGGQPRRSVAAVLHDILGNVDLMVRSEIRLAKAEAREELGAAGSSMKLLVAGAALAYLALAFLLVGVFFLVEMIAAPWLAALAVAVGVGGIAAVMIAGGLKRLRRARPARTVALASRMEKVA